MEITEEDRSSLMDLKPEHARALQQLDILLTNGISVGNSITTNIWTEGNAQAIDRLPSSRDIPAEESWRWNQTKGKKEAVLRSHNASVIFVKLIPRKKNPSADCTIPSYKIWRFTVTYTDNRVIYVLWCEKGKHPDDEPNKLYATKLSYICN